MIFRRSIDSVIHCICGNYGQCCCAFSTGRSCLACVTGLPKRKKKANQHLVSLGPIPPPISCSRITQRKNCLAWLDISTTTDFLFHSSIYLFHYSLMYIYICNLYIYLSLVLLQLFLHLFNNFTLFPLIPKYI